MRWSGQLCLHSLRNVSHEMVVTCSWLLALYEIISYRNKPLHFEPSFQGANDNLLWWGGWTALGWLYADKSPTGKLHFAETHFDIPSVRITNRKVHFLFSIEKYTDLLLIFGHWQPLITPLGHLWGVHINCMDCFFHAVYDLKSWSQTVLMSVDGSPQTSPANHFLAEILFHYGYHDQSPLLRYDCLCKHQHEYVDNPSILVYGRIFHM